MSTTTAPPMPETAETDAEASEGSTPKQSDTDGVSQIVSFRLADEEYGVDIMRAQEIIMMGQITRMPEVPDFICGLINLRGHVIPIVDLRKRFGLEAKENDEHTRIIVANVGDKTIGIVVDAVTEVLRIGPDQIEPPPSSITGIDHDYIRGLIMLEDKLLILLNIDRLLSHDEQATLEQNTGQPSP